MIHKDKYNMLIKSNNFHDFLDTLFQNFKNDFQDYKLKSGFMSFLEETKVNERFSIVCAFGRFIADNGVFNIGASEIDSLSIVYIKKDGIFINKKYIDIITKNDQDVFVYIEFENELNPQEQEIFKQAISKIKNIILEQNWNIEMQSIVNKIKILEPLSKTTLDVLTFSTKKEKKHSELIELIKNDAGLVATLLKVVNSALFGFKNRVENLDSLVTLLGVNFTISIVLSKGIENSLKMDFSVYEQTEESFTDITYSKINLLNIWLSKVDIELKNKLMIPIILSDIGKYIISHEIVSMNLKDDFIKECQDKNIVIYDIEEKFCSINSKDATSLLLNHWKINEDIIFDIKNSKKIEVINEICNIQGNFTEQSIKNGINKAKQYGFDIAKLESSINKLKENIEL
ncbi:MAG TPA: HDOD domain-containing protein [Arcobacter sp.]|nr:HDOD domain-containing protein [Arcobacter sp.]